MHSYTVVWSPVWSQVWILAHPTAPQTCNNTWLFTDITKIRIQYTRNNGIYMYIHEMAPTKMIGLSFKQQCKSSIINMFLYCVYTNTTFMYKVIGIYKNIEMVT